MKSSDFCPFTVSLGVVSERIPGACPATGSSSGQVNHTWRWLAQVAGGRWKVAEAWKVAQEVGGGSMLAGRDSGWSGSMKSRYMRQPQRLA